MLFGCFFSGFFRWIFFLPFFFLFFVGFCGLLVLVLFFCWNGFSICAHFLLSCHWPLLRTEWLHQFYFSPIRYLYPKNAANQALITYPQGFFFSKLSNHSSLFLLLCWMFLSLNNFTASMRSFMSHVWSAFCFTFHVTCCVAWHDIVHG